MSLTGSWSHFGLKGYNVSVLVDAAKVGAVGLKIVVNDIGVTVSANRVREDVNEYIRKMRDLDDLSDMPMVVDLVLHARLVGALQMRFEFVKHQSRLNAAEAEAYKRMLRAVSETGVGRVTYPSSPAMPRVQLQISNDGGKAMSGTNPATNSPGAAVGGGILPALPGASSPLERHHASAAVRLRRWTSLSLRSGRVLLPPNTGKRLCGKLPMLKMR